MAGVFSPQVRFSAQLIGTVVTMGYTLLVTFVLAKGVEATAGLRVDEEAEYTGLDTAEHGEEAYVLI